MPIVPKEILQISTKRPLLAKLAVAVATKPPSQTGLVRYTPEPAAAIGPAQGCVNRLKQFRRIATRYATAVANSIGSTMDGSSFSGLLTRVEIGQIRMGLAGNGRINSRGSGSSLSQRA